MRYVLEDGRHNVLVILLSQKKVLDRFQAIVDKMIPGTGVTVQHGWGLDVLSTIRLAPPAFEGVVCVALCACLVLE